MLHDRRENTPTYLFCTHFYRHVFTFFHFVSVGPGPKNKPSGSCSYFIAFTGLVEVAHPLLTQARFNEEISHWSRAGLPPSQVQGSCPTFLDPGRTRLFLGGKQASHSCTPLWSRPELRPPRVTRPRYTGTHRPSFQLNAHLQTLGPSLGDIKGKTFFFLRKGKNKKTFQ